MKKAWLLLPNLVYMYVRVSFSMVTYKYKVRTQCFFVFAIYVDPGACIQYTQIA